MKTLLATVLLMLLAGIAFAETVQLSWDASNSTDVVGYKIYYKAGTDGLPMDGSEAEAGPSPIDVGNVLSASVVLPDGPRWYFRATAYDSAGYESALSNLAVSGLLPPRSLRVVTTTTTTTSVTVGGE